MNYSTCPYCNQSHIRHEIHVCKANFCFSSSRSATDYDFQIPIEEQGNVQEVFSLSNELRHPRVISDVGNVINDSTRKATVFQDQSTSHPNPADWVDGPAPTLPSFQPTFINNRLWKINREVPLLPPYHTYQMYNPEENIPFICGPGTDTFIPNESQDNSVESNNYRESFDKSCNIPSDKLLNKPSEASNHEELPEDTRNDKPYNCDICKKGFTRKSSLKRHKVTYAGIVDVAGHSRPRQDEYTCLVCGKEFRCNSALLRHSLVHSGIKPFNCNICKKDFSLKSSLKRHKVTHTRNPSADYVLVNSGAPY